MSALSKLDEFLLNPQVRTCSVVVPGTSRSNNSENREPTGDRSLNDLCPDVEFSASCTSNLTESDQEETHHTHRWPFMVSTWPPVVKIKSRLFKFLYMVISGPLMENFWPPVDIDTF